MSLQTVMNALKGLRTPVTAMVKQRHLKVLTVNAPFRNVWCKGHAALQAWLSMASHQAITSFTSAPIIRQVPVWEIQQHMRILSKIFIAEEWDPEIPLADTINSVRQSRSILTHFRHRSKLHSCASHPAKPCRVKPDSQRRKVKVTSTQSNCYFRISNICTPTKFLTWRLFCSGVPQWCKISG